MKKTGVSRGAALTPICNAPHPLGVAAAAARPFQLGQLPEAASGKQPGSRETINKGGGPGRPFPGHARMQRAQSRTRLCPRWGPPLRRPAWRGSGQPEAPPAPVAQSSDG